MSDPIEIFARQVCLMTGGNPDDVVAIDEIQEGAEALRWTLYKPEALPFLSALCSQGWAVVPVEMTREVSAEEVIAYIRAHPNEIADNLVQNNALMANLMGSRKSSPPKQAAEDAALPEW